MKRLFVPSRLAKRVDLGGSASVGEVGCFVMRCSHYQSFLGDADGLKK
jgi:hypothetical protein